MSRLPTPGSDDGNWGEILNDFLEQSHNSDGSIKESAIPKSTNVVTDGSSDSKVPSVKAVKDYTDGKIVDVNTTLNTKANSQDVSEIILGIVKTGTSSEFTVETGNVNPSTGVVTESTNHMTTIDLTGAMIIEFNATGFGSNLGYAFYDNNGTYITGQKTDSPARAWKVKIPTGATQFKLCWNNWVYTSSQSIKLHTPSSVRSDIEQYVNDLSALTTFDTSKVNNVSNFTAWVTDNKTRIPRDILLTYANSLKMSSDMETTLINIKQDGDVVNHDSTLQIDLNGNCYIVSTVNRTGTGDSPPNTSGSTFVRLDVFPISNPSNITSYVVAEYEGSYNGLTLESGAGVPNCYLVGTVLHIFFCSKVDTEYTLIHCTFDTQTSTFGDYSKMQITYNNNTFDITRLNIFNNIGTDYPNSILDGNTYLSLNGNIGKQVVGENVYYYGCFMAGSYYKSGILMKTTDFVTWDFVCIPVPDYDTNGKFEAAVHVVGDYLYYALRQTYERNVLTGVDIPDGKTSIVLARYNLLTNEWIEIIEIPDCSSRPCFFEYNDNLYLWHCAKGRDYGSILKIDQRAIDISYVVQYAHKYSNYPSVFVYNDTLYVTVSYSGVQLKSFTLSTISETTIDNAFKTLLSIT